MPHRKVALVLDDRPSHLGEVRHQLEEQGYQVEIAKSLKAAKQAVLDSNRIKRAYDLIVADSDLGTKLYQKHRALHGLFFVRWCLKNGVSPQKIIYHSTSFDPHNRIAYFLHGLVRRHAQRLGVKVQGKSVLMPSYRNKGKGPPRRRK